MDFVQYRAWADQHVAAMTAPPAAAATGDQVEHTYTRKAAGGG